MHQKDKELLNKPIVNYAQMKKIFTPRNIARRNLYTLVLLTQAMNFLADEELAHTMYAQITAELFT